MTPSVSVVIPVKDGDELYLEELLSSLSKQGQEVEVLVIDSGSTDRSLEIARASNAGIIEISPAEFGHGRTRNLGAESTTGEFICFLTQDATPVEGWLAAYLEAFELNQSIGAAFGPHLPRPTTSPMIARELTEFFEAFSPDDKPTLQWNADTEAFLSNVNACYRRTCWEAIRFRELEYSEDQAFGRDMLNAGWAKAYVPKAAVLHAHDYKPITFMQRYFDEYRGLNKSLGHVEPWNLSNTIKDTYSQATRDYRWMNKNGYPPSKRSYWATRSVLHHSSRKIFSVLGSRSHRLPKTLQQVLSLEDAKQEEPILSKGSVSFNDKGTYYDSVAQFLKFGPAPLLEPVPGLADKPQLNIAFVIPPFKEGSGGHGTICQLIKYLEQFGHNCSIWLHDPENNIQQGPGAIQQQIRKYFQPVKATVYKDLSQWYGADIVVATGWQTVYPVMLLEHCRARAYLVQDHESEFYATSIDAFWAEQTYRLGMHCICAGPWLRTLLEKRYEAQSTAFNLSVDHSIYQSKADKRSGNSVILYARNTTPRRAVPLGLLALEELHQRRPDTEFILFGNSKPLKTPFPHQHLGVATPKQLANAYSKATVGMVLSMTNYSLIPQEMLACGLPCVDIAGFSSEAVFGKEGPVELADLNPIALADAVERLLNDRELWEFRSNKGIAFVNEYTWEDAARQLEVGLRTAAMRASLKH